MILHELFYKNNEKLKTENNSFSMETQKYWNIQWERNLIKHSKEEIDVQTVKQIFGLLCKFDIVIWLVISN